ncbi:ankyrin repeat-containing domain protein [Sporodiniella umbellata]|nr:ankyrin repeat-containing domain protein [Sporodiniella umbellata]
MFNESKRQSTSSESSPSARLKISSIWDEVTLSHLNIKALYQFIKTRGNVTEHNDEGYSLLYLAAHNNSLEALRMLLLQPGIETNATNGPHFELALHAACSQGHSEAVEILIENGSPLDNVDELGHTPLMNAIFSKSEECVKMILEHGVNTSKVDNGGNSLLHLVASNNVPQVVPLLVENNVPIDGHNARGLSPLAVAISYGHKETALALINAGADINGKTRLGTVLHYAVTWNRLEIIQKLIECSCNVQVLNAMEETPLYVAVQQRKIDLVKCLVEQAKADPCFPNGANISLLYAASHGYTEICEIVLSPNTTPYFIQTAAKMSASGGYVLTEKFLQRKYEEFVKSKAVDEVTFDSLIKTFSDEE